MSFTCPGCLWTSENPHDEQSLYCGHCHTFESVNRQLSPFQRLAVKALKHPVPQIAEKRLLRVVAHRRMEQESFRLIWVELDMLLAAERIPQQWRELIEAMLGRISAATGKGLTFEPFE